jgi:hypothetical protein
VKYDGLPADVRREVNERDGGRCRWCGRTDRGVDLHHIRYRKGVADDVPENLVSLCRACHGFVHGTPRTTGVRISKGVAQIVLNWLVEHPGSAGTSRWRQVKHGFALVGLCEHGEKPEDCFLCPRRVLRRAV